MKKTIDSDRVRYFLGDIRDKERLERAFHGVDVVVHCAALKQVDTLEYNPIEAIKTNIMGTQNVINCAIDQGVGKVMMLSTDKAVNPVNLYGASKLCAEKLMIASNAYSKKEYRYIIDQDTIDPGFNPIHKFQELPNIKKPLFSVCRYGNVMNSRGSVLELWKEQDVLTITDYRMTRFWITIEDAVKFVLSRIDSMRGSEIFIPKMDKGKVVHMATSLYPDKKIREIGIRDGEKLHEVLISEDESRNCHEYDDYFEINKKFDNKETFVYTSN